MVNGAINLFDTKPYVEHDATIGYRYVANTRRTLPRPGGGNYEIVINAAGIRSTREYSQKKPPDVSRILVFGDSYAAGQFVSNDQRFTELLERRVPNLEVINFSLEGTGTDQQLLIYEQVALEFEHDLVILLPFLQNIRRNLVEARIALDPQTGTRVLRAKPRFELQDGKLLLRNVPVPMDPAAVAAHETGAPSNDDRDGFTNRLKACVSASPVGRVLKRMMFAVKPWEPFPEYSDATTPAWKLMEAILRRFCAAAAPRPFLIVPVFYDSYVRFRMALSYLDRFCRLGDARVHVIDLLPHFRRLGSDAVRCFQGPHDCHFSPYGHLVVADVLLAELVRLQLLPSTASRLSWPVEK